MEADGVEASLPTSQVEAPAEQGEGGSSEKQPEAKADSDKRPPPEQDIVPEPAAQAEKGEDAAADRSEAAAEQADLVITDAAAGEPAIHPQDDGAAAGAGKDLGVQGQFESHQPSTGTARGEKKTPQKKGKGGTPKRAAARRSRAQAQQHSNDEDATGAAAAPEVAMSTRRSLRSRTSSHKIDPVDYFTEDEADEAGEEPAPPAAGGAPLQNGSKRGGSEDRGVSIAVGVADATQAGGIGRASGEGTPQASTGTDSKVDSDDLPILKLAETTKKKRPAPANGAGLAAATARKRQKADAKAPAAAPAAPAAGEPPVALAVAAGKRGKKQQPDQAAADVEAAAKPAQKLPEEDAPKPAAHAKQPPRPAAQLKQQQTAAQQPKQAQKPKQPTAARNVQVKEVPEGKKQGEASLDPTTLQAKQVTDELDKAAGEFLALQRKQAEIAHKVQGYLGHLDGMRFSIRHLRETMVGKAARKISKWALDPTSKEAATHARRLCEVWMKETMTNVEDRGKSQQASKAPTTAARPPAPEQKAKSQAPPAAEGKTNVTAVTVTPNAVALRTGTGLGTPAPAAAATAPSTDPAADAAGPAASKKLLEAREWCSQHLTPAPTGNATRDQGLLVLWNALMPHGELPPAEAARDLEAAVHERCAPRNGDNAAADPGLDYMHRLRALWEWLSPDSPHAELQLRHMFLQGELAAESLASMGGQQLKALLMRPAAAQGANPSTAVGGASAPDPAAGTPADASQRAEPMEVDAPNQAPAMLIPGEGPLAGAQGPSEPAAKTPSADTGSGVLRQQLQQMEAAQASHSSDMDVDEVPGSAAAPLGSQQQLPGSSAAAPQPRGAGPVKEPLLQIWGANEPLGSLQDAVEPAQGVQADEIGAAPVAQAAGGASGLAAGSGQPSLAPADVPNLTAAVNAARQPELVTPAGSPGQGEGTQPRGWQSAPPGVDDKPVFGSEQGPQCFSKNAGVLFASGPRASGKLPSGQGSDADAAQGGSNANRAGNDAQERAEDAVIAK